MPARPAAGAGPGMHVARIPTVCLRCGAAADPGARFCTRCGAWLPAPGPSPAGPPVSGATRGTAARVPGAAPRGDYTEQALLWMALGFGLGWIPVAGEVGGLLLLGGVVLLFLGRKEYGPAHRRFVDVGIGALVVGEGGAFVANLAFQSALFQDVSGTGQVGLGTTDPWIALGAGFSVLTALASVLLIYRIAERPARGVLWTALGLAAAIAAARAVLTALNVAQIVGSLAPEIELSLLNAFPFLLFCWAYAATRQRLAVGGPRGRRAPRYDF